MATIAITGGKGGTGKTLVATNLAVQFAKDGYSVLLIDTDVENPNTNILLGSSLTERKVKEKPVQIFTPEFDTTKCNKCGKCREVCYRHAILQFPGQFPSIMDHMCSGCTLCQRICPNDAISSKGRIIGKSYFLPEVYTNLDLLIGELTPGEAVSVLIVEDILEIATEIMIDKEYDLVIIDTAPGAHCDVEKSLNAADQIIAVTEPTPFGLHDLKRILELLNLNNHTASVILNRSNLSEFRSPLLAIFKEEHLEILGEIPVDQQIIEDYAKGVPFVLDSNDFLGKHAFLGIYSEVKKRISLTHGGQTDE